MTDICKTSGQGNPCSLNHLMALNAFRGGNKGHIAASPLTEYDKLIGYSWLHNMVEQIRGDKPILGKRLLEDGKTAYVPLEGKELSKVQAKKKSELPFRCAHYYHFKENKRRQDHIDPAAFLFQTSVDIDDASLVDAALEMAKHLDKEEYIKPGAGSEKKVANPWKGMLLHLEYSARKKLHIDIRMPIGMTIEETQRAYCEALGVPCDESCFSPERIIFVTDKQSEIYRSPMWYAVLPEDELRIRREAFLKRGLDIDGRKKVKSEERRVMNSLALENQVINQNCDHSNPSNSNPFNSNHEIKSYENGAVLPKDDAAQPSPVGSHQVSPGSPAHSLDSHAATGHGSSAPDIHRGVTGGNPATGESTPTNSSSVASVPQASNNTSVVGVQHTSNASSVASVPQTSADKSLIVFDLFRQQVGLSEETLHLKGSRHSSLLAILSAGASRVINEQELTRVVAIRMPEFSQERDCQQLIHDFYAKYGDSSKPFSRDVIRINALAEAQSQKLMAQSQQFTMQNQRFSSQGQQFASQGQQFSSSLANTDQEDEYPDPPEMPKKLPKLVELLVSKTPDIYKPAVANAIFPPLATHLWRTSFRYIDNVEHEATLMCVCLAGTGAGKSCVQMPINMIMEDIRKRDQENLAREKEWKDEVTRKGANKDKRKRPQNLIIQEIDADMTNPAFVMRTAEAQEHFLYTSLNEIDQFDALKGTGNQQFRIMCLAFDPGNQYGQTRVGTQSVTERVCVRFNWNASTTIEKGQRYFSHVLTDGPISRINFCTIPEQEIGSDMPVYGTYDEAFREALRPYIDNLCRATGRIECEEAFRLAQKLKDENADFSRLTQSRTFENLSFRANVIAYLKACVLYVANGCRWEPEIEDFIRWSEQYDLHCKMHFFGDAIEKAKFSGEKSSKRGPCNLLMMLPDTFSYQQVEQLRQQRGLNAKGTRNMVNQWVHRKYIEKVVNMGAAHSGGTGNGGSAADGNYNYSNDSFMKLQFRNNE